MKRSIAASARIGRVRPRRRRLVAGLASCTLALLVFVPAAQAVAPVLWETGKTGSGAGQTNQPRGIVANPDNGHLYVAEQENYRISEFSAWGTFVRAWGWDVAPEGAAGDTPSDQFEICTATCKAGASGPGAGQLFRPQGVALDSSGNVYVTDWNNLRVQKFSPTGQFLAAFGGDVVTGGATGTGTLNGTTTISAVTTTSKAFMVGQTITASDGGIPPETRITAVGPNSITLSQPATTSGPVTLTVAAGAENVPTNEKQTVAIGGAPTGGTFTLTFSTPNPSSSSGTTTPIAFNAPATDPGTPGVTDSVQEALEALSNIGVGDVSVSGPNGGPWVVTFQGTRFADTDVNQMSADASGLTPAGGKTVTMTSANGAEVCTVTNDCRMGAKGTANGQFDWPAFGQSQPPGNGDYIAIDSADRVYVGGEANRIQRFNAAGIHQANVAIPGEVVQSLAVDGAGNLYATFGSVAGSGLDSKPGVRELSPTGTPLATFAVPNPRAVAVDPAGDVYAFDRANTEVLRFTSSGAFVEKFAEDLYEFSTGLTANDVTGAGGIAVYASNGDFSNSFIRAYSPIPDPDIAGPPPSVAPTIADPHATSVEITEATLAAEINPNFWADTEYRVQYATEACLEGGDWEAACVAQSPQVTLTSEVTDKSLPATATLTGLAPDTTYRYRFAAESSGGGPAFGAERSFATYPPNPAPETGCPNPAFRGGASAPLPDCRAYEMVSPVEKNNGDIRADLNLSNVEQLYAQASLDGGKLAYSSTTAFGDAVGAPYVSQYIASRDEVDGWSTHAITPARETNLPGNAEDFLVNQFLAFSEDLCTGWLFWDGDPPLGESPTPGLPGYRNLYKRSNCGANADSYEALTTRMPPNALACASPGSFCFNPQLQGFSADGSHVFYRANDALAVDDGPLPSPGTPGEGSRGQVYEVYDGGKVRLVSVLPNGTVSTQANTVGLFSTYDAGSSSNAVSADGSRVFWTSSPLGELNPGTLYVRIEGSFTIQASEGSAASFWAANPEGTAAIFTEAGELRRFAVDTEERTTIATGVQGVAGASEDLSRIYFVSTQVLDPNPNSEGDTAVAGQPNLYLHEEGVGTAFVGTLATGEGSPGTGETGGSITNQLLVLRLARVSPDGRHLAFVSRAPLTGYDNTDVATGAADTEVFHFAADTHELECVSCNPSGARPAGSPDQIRGRAGASAPRNFAGIIPGHQGHFHTRRVLSSDGQRLFFESFDPLLPRDTNGKMDVYQWQAPGKGACSAGSTHYFPQNGGCLALISSGQGAGNSEFIEATPSGEDVFFRTESSLLPQDPGLEDIYDARVGGGFEPPPPPVASCEGDACQPGAVTPEFAVPSSSAFSGPGDPNPNAGRKPRCRKGKRAVRRAGKTRCVTKQSKGKAKSNRRAGR
ncbi:MAG TPA: hypothetical protein VNP96_01915 [Solirubrobacterales bacterium]|nr:hypothetical protein [Solirubrobacterales bacterium]